MQACPQLEERQRPQQYKQQQLTGRRKKTVSVMPPAELLLPLRRHGVND